MVNVHRLALLGILLLTLNTGLSQEIREKIEKRRLVWQDAEAPDSLRFQAIDRMIMRGYRKIDTDSAHFYIEKQLDFARARKNQDWIAKALANKGRLFLSTASYSEAFSAYQEALEIRKAQGDINGVADSYQWMGYARREQGMLTEALSYYQKSLDQSTQLGDEGRAFTAATLNSVGSLFLDQDDYDKALEYYQESLKLHLAINKPVGLAANYNNISQVYYFKEDYEQARVYLEKSRVIKEEIHDLLGLGNIYHNLGDLAVKARDFEKADQHYQKSLELRDSINNKTDIASSYNALGYNALRQQQPTQAIIYCQQGFQLAKSTGSVSETSACADCLYQAFQQMNQSDSALVYHVLMSELQDSLFNQETTRKLTQMELQYQFEKERTVLQHKLQRQQLIRNVVIAFGLMMLMLLYLIYRNNQFKAKTNKRLKQKQQQIERDNALISKQAEELKALDQMKSRFFSNISHELRTPLTLISVPLEEGLKQYQGRIDKDLEETLKTAYKNADKLADFVEELLELSRIEAGKVFSEKTPTNLHLYLHQLFTAFESAAKVRNLAYEFENHLAEDSWVLIDKKFISKIVNNLLGNTLKFTPFGGKVTLKAELQDHNRLLLSVTDTGRGIAEEDLPHIFDRYFQSKNKELTTAGGNGIGLALVKELVEIMNGQVSVESEWGKGSTFSIKIPIEITDAIDQKMEAITEEEPAALSPLFATIKESASEAPKILIVEDNHDMQELLVNLLSDNYDYIIANDGAEAWSMLENKDPKVNGISLILSDIMMPVMDGYALLERIKQHDYWRRLPVVMLTALTEEADKLQALRQGVDDYLTKPFSAEELYARIENLIAKYEEREAFNSLELPLEFESTPSADERWLTELKAICLSAINRQIELNNTYLANHFALSVRQLQRQIKSLTGMTVKEYVQEARLQKALHLLENRIYNTMSEVAYASGFNTPSYFSRQFEKRFGRRPTSYFE